MSRRSPLTTSEYNRASTHQHVRCTHRVPAECPESVRDLIAACMDAEPGERPSAREIVEVLTSGDGKGLKQQKYPRRRRSTPEVRLQGFWPPYML